MTDTHLVHQLADELLQLSLTADPVTGTILGIPGYDDRLADRSEQAQQATRAAALDIAARLEAVGEAGLGADDVVTRAAALHHARQLVTEVDVRGVEYTITDMFAGPAAEILSMLPMIVLNDAADAAAYLARLRGVPAFLETVAERHRAGCAAGRVPVAHLVRAAADHLDRYLAAPEDVLARPAFGDPAFDEERAAVLAGVVRPAFARYRDVLREEVLPHGRDTEHVGLCHLPGGDELYAGLARIHTTTDRTPEELHRTGLDVIARLAEEYAELGERVFGTRDLPEIFGKLSSDPAMRWRDGAELLDSARTAITRAEAAVPAWFGRLAGTRCKVEPVPEADAPGSPAAFYMFPSMDGRRPGIYFANTYRAEERDRFVSEVMAFHEGVPGHHFQIALAQELTDLPVFRRVVTPTAYAEGWGLYCERLADEMGLYSSDIDRLGMLTMDSMRAGRLVVDTGMHAKGWTREHAVAFLRDNTAMGELEIGTEIDRYIAMPGQALSYMVGRLEIQRIRAAAEARLGERFDIRAFHDVVLTNGPLPLAVLDRVVRAWNP